MNRKVLRAYRSILRTPPFSNYKDSVYAVYMIRYARSAGRMLIAWIAMSLFQFVPDINLIGIWENGRELVRSKTTNGFTNIYVGVPADQTDVIFIKKHVQKFLNSSQHGLTNSS